MKLFKLASGLLSAVLRMMARIAGALFGRVQWRIQWQVPPWLGKASRLAKRGGEAVRARPGWSMLAASLALIALIVGVVAYQWWQNQPKPRTIGFSIEAPARTVIEDNGAPSPLVVEFAGSVAPIAMVDKEVAAGVEISPALAGKWTWRGDSRLEFLPKDDWPVGIQHKVRFDQELVSPQTRLERYDFTFRSPAFVARIANSQLYQDPVNPGLKKAVIDLNFSHPVNPEDVEKRISMVLGEQGGGLLGLGADKVKFTVSFDKLKLNAYVHSDTLAIPRESTRLTMTLAGGLGAARGGTATDEALKAAVRVPGLFSLAVNGAQAAVAANERGEPEHVLVVSTSEDVHERNMQQAITAWVLPRRNPERKDEEGDSKSPYAWNDPREITEKVLAAGTRLPLEAIPAERENVDRHSFRISADVGRYVYVQVEKGLRSFGGYELRQRFQRVVRIPAFPPELKILSQGSLLALSGERKLAVLVRDLPGIKIEIGRVLPAQIQHLVSQSGGNFATPEFSNYNFGQDNLAERFERTVPLPNLKRGKPHYEAVNLGDYLKSDGAERRGVFLLTVRGHDPAQTGGLAVASPRAPDEEGEDAAPEEDEQPVQRAVGQWTDRRLVVVTDLGILVKKSTDGSQDVFVQSIHSGTPTAGAVVDVIGKNGLTVMSQTTDATGRVHFANLNGLTRERAPLMYLVRSGGDMSFLPLNRQDRGLDMSRFDIGGESNARAADQLSAYLFSDRGIYRPGEQIRVGSIVRVANWAKSAAGLPLEAEILDSRGLAVKRERLKVGAGGFNEITHATLESSPTGTYTVNLLLVKDGKVADRIGSTTVKVQEFLPDRMKASARLSAMAVDGWVKPAGLKGLVNVQNLFGTPAANRRVEAMVTLTPAYPAFRGYPDFKFYDPQRAKEGYSDKLADGTTNEQGEAEFALGLERYAKASYRVSFLARAFEPEGGRSVSADSSVLVSDLPFLVGFKADGAYDYVTRGSKRSAEIIAIAPNAKKTAATGLTLQHIERKSVSVLTRQPNDTWKYESRQKNVTLKETPLAIAAGGHTLTLATDVPGDFSYVIRDASGLEMNRIEYSVAGTGNVTRSLERNAELQLKLNKKDYAPGEEIEISVRAPYTGAGLITIERDRVYAHQWFRAGTLASVQKIRVPKDFEGNGYMSVQYVRDPSSDEIFTSPLSFGVAPFMTSLAARTNTLTLSTPDVVKPGQVVRMKLKAEQATRAVVFAVDEGVLQVAHYEMADPLSHFFRKRALEVRTAQILDLILPEFRKLMNAAAPGGDAEGMLSRNLNPFKRKRDKPVAYWSGLVEVKGEREFTYEVPDTFNGTLRVMAVAVNDSAIGTAQSRLQVRGDFVLAPNLPLAVAPGDEFEVSVGVANNVVGSGKEPAVNVELKASPAFEQIGPARQSLKIGEMRESVAVFRLKARDGDKARLGSATLSFSASLDGRSATLAQDISVRPATPYATQVSAGSYKGSAEAPVKRKLYSEFRDVTAATSPIPLVLAGGLSNYLSSFPHACTEQLVSQAMSAVVLGKRPEFAAKSRRAAPASVTPARSLDDTLRVLRTRQNSEGGFGLWTASVQADEFATVYASHLLLEARERDEATPLDMLKNGIEYLQRLAASPAADLYEARVRAYAAYLLTRQGVVTTPYLTALREMLETRYPKEWKQDLAAGYMAASYQLLKQEGTAESMIDPLVDLLVRDTTEFAVQRYYDPLIRSSQTLYLLARHFPQRARSLPAAVFESMVKTVQRNRFSTLSAAYTILALDAYAANIGDQEAKLSIVEIGVDGKETPLALPAQLMPQVEVSSGAAKVRFANASDVTNWFVLTESGFDRTPPTDELKAGIELIREYLGADGKPVSSVRLGDEVTVRLRVRAIGRDFVPNIALVDLLPGGFEAVLNPVGGDGQQDYANRIGRGSWHTEYADIREDRVVLYGSAGRDVAEFSYRIKATNSGSFVVPPAWVESLYERDIQGRAPAGRISVERPAAK
jgi:uncharacterized protein YfaS (alpha-2-macroglobulin family)